MEYKGNAICNYVKKKNLDYYYSAEHTWMLVYGDSECIPKIMVFASKVDNISSNCSDEELNEADKASSIAKYLNLPVICIRFMENSKDVCVKEESDVQWKMVSYDRLRDIYEGYGVVKPGTVRKQVNQSISSSYHAWQRANLGEITATDFDLIKYADGEVKEIIELKRSKEDINKWKPYPKDYSNFALLINMIIHSGKKIPFTLYYNLLMKEDKDGKRNEDISKIKVFDFIIPANMIKGNQVQHKLRGFYTLNQLLV